MRLPRRIPLLLGPVLLALLGRAAAEEVAAASNSNARAAEPRDEDWSTREFWRTIDGEPVSEAWRFEGEEISLVEPHRGGNIVTPPLPPHFELSWRWRIQSGANGGLKYRVRPFAVPALAGRYLGLEYQIIDSAPDDTSRGSTGAIYALVKPAKEKVLNPPGEWNSSRVVAVGDHVEHYLNGALVASASTVGPAWDTTVALSKFHGADDFGRPAAGDRVMLTDHGGQVSYRDFHFVAREAPPPRDVAGDGPFLANASRNGWADQSSIVVWTRTTARREMVADGRAFVGFSTEQADALARGEDPEALLRAQLPEGATLGEMNGACPGAPGRVRLSYFPESEWSKMRHTEWVTTTSERDFTAQWKLDNLVPGSRYSTVIEAQTLSGEPAAVLRGAFRTAPLPDDPQPLVFCVTTCHDFIRRDDGPRGHKIYAAMQALAPDFVVHAGDIEYYDQPDPWGITIDLMRFKWARLFSLPANRDFYNRTTSYFIKDDHDTLTNDSWPGQRYGAVTFEEGVRLFNEEQFPSHTPRYAHIRWGRDLEIWILEGRDYRSPNTLPDGPEKTILGKEQKAWLFETLQASDAAFKLVLSPTPIVGPDRPQKGDNHANENFAWEGGELRARLSRIPGVIVLCGDRHWQYASIDAETGLWEFGCGPGSERHQLGWKAGDERPEHRFVRVDGGFLTGTLMPGVDGTRPTLRIHHHSVSGERQSCFDFPAAFAPRP